MSSKSNNKYAMLLGGSFIRHDLATESFTYEQSNCGDTVLMTDPYDGIGFYMGQIDVSKMRHGESLTVILKYETDVITLFYFDAYDPSSPHWGMHFPEGATVSGVVTIHNYDGELYV